MLSQVGIRKLLALAVLAVASWILAQAPQISTGGSTFFEREGGKNRTRFQGDVSQLPDGRMVLKRFRMETLGEREEPEMHIEAPECFFEVRTKGASSPGPLKVARVDGLFTIEGEGFSWDQKSTRLVISNRVRAVIRRRLFGTTNALPN